MRPASGKRGGDAIRSGTILKPIAHNGGREKKQCPREDDWHHPGIIHFQWHVLGLAAIHLSADYPLCILHSNFPDALGDRDDSGDDKN